MNLKIALASSVAVLVLSAAPASAQSYGRYYQHDHPYAERSAYQLDRLRNVLREGARSGALSRWEARRLFPQLRDLYDLRERFIYSRGGMSEREAYALSDQIGVFRQDVRQAVWDGRGYGHYRDGDYRDDWRDRRDRYDD